MRSRQGGNRIKRRSALVPSIEPRATQHRMKAVARTGRAGARGGLDRLASRQYGAATQRARRIRLCCENRTCQLSCLRAHAMSEEEVEPIASKADSFASIASIAQQTVQLR